MEKRYDPKEAEPKIQKFWQDSKIFRFDSKSKKPIFSIDTPPRYTSGPLHIGHATSYSHQDFFARYKKMIGFNVFFPLCFDVNGMPIEVAVERRGVRPEKVGREKFIDACAQFAKENIKIMTAQFRQLGFSMDSSIYYQTDSPDYRRLTQLSFIQLYKKGLVYRAEAPVNWCPRCVTAIAEAEVEYRKRETKLNYIKFYFDEKVEQKGDWIKKDEKGSYLVIATSRPELLAACVLTAVHPDDERYKHIVGKNLTSPIYGKKVKIVADPAVLPAFGTGAVMICTIGDRDDLDWIRRHKILLIKALNERGKLTEVCGKYAGLDIETAKEKIINDLKKADLLIKQEPLEQNVSTCWRCHTPTEYIVTREWFLKILPFKKDVLAASKKMKWFPKYMERRLIDWIEGLTWDWCISRRRYLATPIPIWECKCGEVVLAKPEQCYVDPLKDKPPLKNCPKCSGELKGSELVFDTWMDSSLTPFYNCFWQRDEKLFKKLFPMSLRPQACEIIRTWLYYTTLRSLLLTNQPPFKNITISGFILGPDGRPMHASWGNVVRPEDVLSKYSADAFRYSAALCDLGVDTAFKWADIERGRKLLIKLWNVGRFVEPNLKNFKKMPKLSVIDKWIISKLNKIVESCTKDWEKYDFNHALSVIESFFWHDFCDNYLEIVKHRLYNPGKKDSAKYTLYETFLAILKLLAPITPHITEEIWQKLFKKFEKKESIHISGWPVVEKSLIDKKAEQAGELAVLIISSLRQWKHEKKMALNAPLKEIVIECDKSTKKLIEPVLQDIKGTMKISKIEFGLAKEIVLEKIKIDVKC